MLQPCLWWSYDKAKSYKGDADHDPAVSMQISAIVAVDTAQDTISMMPTTSVL